MFEVTAANAFEGEIVRVENLNTALIILHSKAKLNKIIRDVIKN